MTHRTCRSERPAASAAPRRTLTPAFETFESRVLLSVGSPINTTRSLQNEFESAIAINPGNPNELFAVSDENVLDRDTGEQAPGLVAVHSTDGGATWSPRRLIATGAPGDLGTGSSDAALAWDQFNNLWLACDDTQDGGDHVVLAVSTNGGETFTEISRYNAPPQQWRSEPSLAVGPGPTPNTGSVWLTYQRGASDGTGGAMVHGAQVLAPGQWSAFTPGVLLPGSGNDAELADIAVGPNGQVAVAYQWRDYFAHGYGEIRVNVDPDGLGPQAFTNATTVTTTLVAQDVIGASNGRLVHSNPGLAWDRSGGPYHGRLYLSYVDAAADETEDLELYVRRSDNGGASWSPRTQVNNDQPPDNDRPQFLPRIALDQTTGNVGLAWYDAREHTYESGLTDFYGGVSVDGGQTFSNFRISDAPSNSIVVDNSTWAYGDQTGLAFHAGRLHPTWSDNSNSTGDNPGAAGDYPRTLDLYSARIDVPSIPVAGRHVFYNGSLYDGNNPAAQAPLAGPNNDDDDAIAPDKRALLPGQTATYANYTNYEYGINGIMIDVYSLPATTLTAADFVFKVGNDNNPAAWAAGPAPTITVREGEGLNGADRVTLVWPQGSIVDQWLQVTMRANANTGLSAPDVFYFGNLGGEVGNASDPNRVSQSDIDEVKLHLNQTVPITAVWDLNRDGRVNALDVAAVKRHLDRQLELLSA
jgi:hypothetical protein